MNVYLRILVLMEIVSVSIFADSRQKFMQDFVLGDDFYRNESLSDEKFVISTFFSDFNGDGKEEAIACPQGLDFTDGWEWIPLYRDSLGVVQIGLPEGRIRKEPDVYVFAWGRQFYRAEFSVGGAFLGRHLRILRHEPDGTPTGRETTSRQDAILTMNSKGRLSVHELPNEIDDIVCNPGFEKLERAFWENYQGREMKRVPWSGWCCGYKPIPAEQLRPLGGIAEPPEFATFVRRYRAEVKSRLNATNDVIVLAVFHDANNDGDVDAYVTSSVERTEGDRYRWHLYLNGKDGFTRATHRISKRVRELDDMVFVETEEVVPRTAFHRVVRFGRLPSVIVLEKIGKRVHTRGFLKYVTEDERRRQPYAGPANRDKKKGEDYREWCDEVDARLGYVRPLDLRELVDDFSFFRLERLPCREFSGRNVRGVE